MAMNSNNTKEEMMNNQAQENQAAGNQQQTPAEPEKKSLPVRVGEKVGAFFGNKHVRRIGGVAMLLTAFAGGVAVGSNMANNSDEDDNSDQAAESVVETTATEETVG